MYWLHVSPVFIANCTVNVILQNKTGNGFLWERGGEIRRHSYQGPKSWNILTAFTTISMMPFLSLWYHCPAPAWPSTAWCVAAEVLRNKLRSSVVCSCSPREEVGHQWSSLLGFIHDRERSFGGRWMVSYW